MCCIKSEENTIKACHYCILLCGIPLWRWPKKAETCRGYRMFVYYCI